MIDQDKMRALAKRLREKQADCDESLQAAHAIYALLAALEVAEGDLESSDQKRKEAILDAEKARDERNRAHVKLNAEWIEKTNALRAELEAAAAELAKCRSDAAEEKLKKDDSYCATHCKTMCQNSIYGYCRGAPQALAQRQGE